MARAPKPAGKSGKARTKAAPKAKPQPATRRARKIGKTAPPVRHGPPWDERFVVTAGTIVALGGSDEQVAEALGCDLDDIAFWREEHPAFDRAFERDPRTGGRPTLWDDRNVEIAKGLAKLGATDLDVAQAFGVSVRTIHRWKLEYPEFAEALRLGKEEADSLVEQSLFKRATGYTFDSEKIVTAGGVVQRVETMQHVPPDTTAAIFWLKNRKAADWRDTKNLKHGVDEDDPLADFLKEIGGRTFKPVDK
ncbi:hypothetical protein [Shinella pollutisoli]|uniref:Homeodomain-like domain-containing protein n=1 Tax=Shinella pollutisoli TaxID=2250594 RepID=A0ABV7DJZ8_9HYPH|nr:hypothetical protein [Shinella pollutisoli]